MKMERVKGIEPSSQPWEGRVLPMNYTRTETLTETLYIHFFVKAIVYKNINLTKGILYDKLLFCE